MAGETYAIPGPIAPGDTVKATWGEKVNESLVVNGRSRLVHCGGSDTDGHTNTSYERLRNTSRPRLCAEDYRGLTLTARVLVRVVSGATVRVKLRDLTGGDVGEMASAVGDTTVTAYSFALTPPSGTTPKECEWQIKTSDGSKPAFAVVAYEVAL